MSELQPIRYCATVEYDGTDFFGYQRQLDKFRTVQGELEKGLARINRKPVTVLGAGRTDSGVHATGQVIAFDLKWGHGTHKLQRALNANIPADVAVNHVQETTADFHPRFDATRRAYRYFIFECSDHVPQPTRRRFEWQRFDQLDLEQMNKASQLLIGTHDFAAFGLPPQGNNTVRTVFEAKWSTLGDQITFDIEANAFLYRMVRSLVGSLAAVGSGKWSILQFQNVLESKDRAQCAAAAPPTGLFLRSVSYENS